MAQVVWRGAVAVVRRREVWRLAILAALVAGAVGLVASQWGVVTQGGVRGATLVWSDLRGGLSRVAAPGVARSTSGGSGAAVSSGSSQASVVGGATVPAARGYFAAARLRRASAESQEIDALRQVIDGAHTSTTARAEASQQLLQLERERQQEVTAELVLAAKGFSKSLVLLRSGGATVVVRAAPFTASQAAEVAQAVASVAGINPAQVQIVPRA